MINVRGTPVNISGRTGDTPGPAPSTGSLRVAIPVPPGRQLPGSPLAPATTFARYLRIRNLDGTNSLRVGFLNDVFVTLKANEEKEFAGDTPFFTVQASASTVQWEAYAVVAS